MKVKLEMTYRLCPRCWRAVPYLTGEKFCIQCGAEMLEHCPNCKSPIVSPFAKFCGECGFSYHLDN